jgi:hypothetical protein
MELGPHFVIRAIDGLPRGQLMLRGLWIAIRLIAVFYLGESGARFFYQGF